ncbi:MAG: YabP/YqfC family sporulation protein [Oscillospiraceae bacterium]|nr:YabP/YqfC family sporulation protein [Oscillospiraceae bacterium]
MGLREKLIEYEEAAGKRFSVTMTAESGEGTELIIENCRCVKSCDDNFIVLSVSGMDIRISGTPLVIENFGIGSLKITGKVHSLTFEEN